MVTVDFSQKLVRQLELYLLQQANYVLPINGYDLILLLPIAPDSWSDKRTLLLSSLVLSKATRWDATYAILSLLRQGLTQEEYLSIYNVDLIEPTAYTVQQIKRYIARREDGEIEAPISLIGGVTNQIVTAIKSTILEKLALGQAYQVELLEATFDGQLVSIGPQHDDVVMVFDTETGRRSCLFSELVQLQPLPRAAR